MSQRTEDIALLEMIMQAKIMYLEMPDGFRFTLMPDRAMWLTPAFAYFPEELQYIWTGEDRASKAIEAYKAYKAKGIKTPGGKA